MDTTNNSNVQEILGDNNDNIIVGTDNDERINSGNGQDSVDGGAGKDTLIVDYSDNTYTGTKPSGEIQSYIYGNGAGGSNGDYSANITPRDFNRVEFSNIEQFEITGTPTSDNIRTYTGNDLIDGGAGDDSLNGGFGVDTIIGGEGVDQIVKGINPALGGDDVNLTLTDNILVGQGSYTFSEVESAHLEGQEGNNIITAAQVTELNVTLDGAEGNDTLIGGAKDDLLAGEEGFDRLEGRGGNDLLYGNENNDTLVGGDGNDSLYGQADNDEIYGGVGNDLVSGGEGDDSFFGGAGRDRVVEIADVNFSLSDTELTGNGIDTLQSIEAANLVGGDSDNQLDATDVLNLNVTFQGAAGSDTLLGSQNSDLLFGQEGDDILEGYDGDDTLSGESGEDKLTGGSGNDKLYGGIDDDTISGGSGDDQFFGGTGIDRIVEVADADFTLTDTKLTGEGTDTLSQIEIVSLATGASNNKLDAANVNLELFFQGAGGDDTLFGGKQSDQLFGQNDNDVIDGAGGDDTLSGGNGNDQLFGRDGNDDIYGGIENDTMSGGLGDDQFFGGAGIDRILEVADVDFTLVDNQLTGLGTDTFSQVQAVNLKGGEGDNTLDAAGINDLSVTLQGAAGNDTLIGGQKNDFLNGQEGDDSLVGNASNDKLFGLDGNDIISGGLGDDLINGGAGDKDRVVETADVDFTLSDTSLTGLGADTLSEIEKATITTGDGDNVLDASQVTQLDILLSGGAGDDTLKGGASVDFLYGQDGNDLSQGNGGDDIISSGSGNDRLEGGFGNDKLYGGVDNDTMSGSLGDDQFFGGAGIDRIVEIANVDFTLTDNSLSGLGADTLNQIQTASLKGGAGNNTIDASGAINLNVTLQGALGDDTLIGGSKNDFLNGQEGNDVLYGGDSNDILFGGSGSDVFVLQPGKGVNAIKDFEVDTDSFGLENPITFADLTISDNGVGTPTTIVETSTSELIAVVDNVLASELDMSDFITM